MHVLFLHVGWARAYRGDPDNVPKGTFRHLRNGNVDVGEAYNFRAYRNVCYGYSPVRGGTIDIGKLGAIPTANYVTSVLVIWTATHPGGEGRFIVGWWRNATVYRALQETRPEVKRPEFVAKADVSNCLLLAPDERIWVIPCRVRGWPGVSSSFLPVPR